ncbi:MAG: hypothetical protein ACYC9L_16035 [Sulfuricaulis sp.]
MTEHTDSDRIDVKKMRQVPSPCNVDEISIEKGLQKIYKAACDVETYIGVAAEAAMTDDPNAHYDRLDAIQLMMKHAHEAINTTWGLADDLGKALGVDVHAKQEEHTEA